MFSFPCQKENTFLSLHKTLIKPPSLCISCRKQLNQQLKQQLKQEELRIISLEHSLFQVFFPSNFSISLYYFLYVFIFFVRSVRIIAKNPLILFNLLCLFRKKTIISLFLYLLFKQSIMVYLLPVKFFLIPSFLLPCSNKFTEKTNQIHHKQAIKSTFFPSHSVASLEKKQSPNFPIQSLPCFPVPGSSTKRERGKVKGGGSVNLLFALFLIHFPSVIITCSRGREGWELGRRSRSLRSSPPAPYPLNLWFCPASLENRGMARENRERIGELEKENRERTAKRES